MTGPVFLVTPTGGRPDSFSLLAEYLDDQTHAGPLTWLVCDDVDPATPLPNMREGINCEVIRPDWRWRPGDASTQARSLAALLGRVPTDASLVIAEDDDVYLPDHVETMLAGLETAELVGQRVSLYYNVASRRHRALRGIHHASLGATALRGAALDTLRAVCARGSRRIDMDLWTEFTGTARLVDTRTVVGIKGMPGRPGIGVGHRDTFGDIDPTGTVLRHWIAARADAYP